MRIFRSIQNRIYEIRGERVMLDFDLAQLYQVSTKAFNQAVKRNIDRFPGDFMFRLIPLEWEILQKEQHGDALNRSQIVTSLQKHRPKEILPYAFTEQGVAMLSGILNSKIAIDMNIAIMRAFIEVRKMILNSDNWKARLKEIVQRINEHDIQLNQIYDALENLLDEHAAQRKWDARDRIGFKPSSH